MAPMTLVLTPSTRSQRSRLQRHLLLFLLAALPVAGVLLALVNWWIALLYVVVQTSVLMFGVRQQRTSVLRVDGTGIQYEAEAFLLRTSWSNVERIADATLPSGPSRVILLTRPSLRWARDTDVRRQARERGWDRIIPIDEFDPRWPDGRLADEIRRHRPDLLG